MGVRFRYAVQEAPGELADAFLVGREFIGADRVCLVLGDNLFFGHGFQAILDRAARQETGATIFGYRVQHPERYGVVELDADGNPVSLEEKPSAPKSRWAVPGLYFYDNQVVEIAANLQPSGRGELEITDLNRQYLAQRQLRVECFGWGLPGWMPGRTRRSCGRPTSCTRSNAVKARK